MKTGLFLALLVLLASTTVFGQRNGKQNHSNRFKSGAITIDQDTQDRPDSTSDQIIIGDQQPEVMDMESTSRRPSVHTGRIRPLTVIHDGNTPITLIGTENRPITLLENGSKPITILRDRSTPAPVSRDRSTPDPLSQDQSMPTTVGHDGNRRVTDPHHGRTPSKFENEYDSEEHEGVKPASQELDKPREGVKPASQKFDRSRERVKPTSQELDKPREGVKPTSQKLDRSREGVKPASQEFEGEGVKPTSQEFEGEGVKPVSQELEGEGVKPTSQKFDKSREGVKPSSQKFDRSRESVKPTSQEFDRSREDVDHSETTTAVVDGENNRPFDETRPMHNVTQGSDKTVHVSGNILLVKYDSSIVDSVQYDLDGARLVNGARPLTPSRTPVIQDFIAHESQVTLYVATSKTTDRKLAFAQFPIQHNKDHFPLSFDIDVTLPDKQRGFLERADITLYFFVYITNLETRIDTFLPAGTSQILLQGTNRLIQKLDVNVRANGIEITGLFRSRYGQRYIQPGTSFQVLIVPEQSLATRDLSTSDSVAQLIINNVPAMFPVPFSLLVNHQMLTPNTKYYAIAYAFENGIRRRINHEPILVINEQRILVAPRVIFTVIPSPFILRGTVTRSMPGSFVLQPRSSLIIRLHEIGSNTQDIVFKLPEIVTLPQIFQINVTQSERFDPSKNYDIRALITDEKNDVYMASLQPLPLADEFTRLTVPVDDLLYYVQVRLHSSSNQLLSYVPGSTAQIFITESPETPTKPIVARRIDTIGEDFRDFSLEVPATAIQPGRNYYLVMMIEINGIITHVSKTLLISNNQPPPLLIQLPVLSLNLIRGVVFDVDNRPAQWSSSSYANLFLLDDKAADPEKAIVQVWKIHLENDFPVRFEIQLDFSLLRPDHVYRLQSAIENTPNLLEYKPAGSVLAINPTTGIMSDVRLPVRNVKTSQFVKGLIYINDMNKPLPEKSEIIVQLSSSPSLTNPSIIDEIHIKADGRSLPIDFTMKLPLDKIDVNSVYYFLVQYIVRDNVVIPASQAFAFSPRNEATVVLTLSKTPQIPITGQVTSTGRSLDLPSGSTLHLYITDNLNPDKPTIFSEVFLQSTLNNLYEFTMNIGSVILQKKIPLYLRADILYQDQVILSIPRPALLQITPGGEWNINLVIDLPTLITGRIIAMNQHEGIRNEFDVYIQIIERGTKHVVYTAELRLDANLPQKFRIELDNDLFSRYSALQARALIKNCKDQILFESAGNIDIHPGLNLQIDLPVLLTDFNKLNELQSTNHTAPLNTGSWRLSVTGVVNDARNGDLSAPDNTITLEQQ